MWTSYGQSKTANVLSAVGAGQRWADDGIAVNALMPGNVASTALARHMTPTILLPSVKRPIWRCLTLSQSSKALQRRCY